MSGRSRRRVLAVVRNPVGGIRNYIKYTYGALDPAVYGYTVLAVESDESAHLRADLEPLNARVVEVESPRALTREAIREARSGFHDLIHSHGLKSGSAASPAAWTSRLPHVITSHDVFLPEQFSGPKGLPMKIFLTAILNRSSAVHSVSAGADRNLGEYLPRVKPELRHVVLNGIPAGPTDDPEESHRWRSQMAPGGETLFGFFGRFMPQKGFEYVIAAAEKLQADPQTKGRFRVVAVNDGSYVREYRALVEKRGLGERFVFAGFFPQARRLMGRVDAVLMPSLWEACGLVAMEAMSAGAPLISTAVHGLADVTAASPAIIIEPRNAESLARGMKTLMAGVGKRTEAARAFSSTAAQRFDIRASAAGLEKIFDRVLIR